MLGRFRSPPKPFTTGKELVVHITKISYTEARLMSTARYENARVEVGCTVSLTAEEDRNAALEEAKSFVRDTLVKRLIDMEESAKHRVYVDQRDHIERKYRL